MRYSVVVEVLAANGSVNRPCIYSFDAADDEEARAAFLAELRKKCTIFHRESRLCSGGVFWANAILVEGFRVLVPL